MATLTLSVGSVLATDLVGLLDGHPQVALLEKNCIQTDVSVALPLRFETIVQWLDQPHVIDQIQQEYRKTISKDGEGDASLVINGPGSYSYINEKNQPTTILELCRKRTSNITFDLIYFVAGKRYFGKHETLIHIHVVNAGAAGTIYMISIHTYPHNPLVRFFARRKKKVKNYFRNKALLIAQISFQIGQRLNDIPSYSLQPKPLSATSIPHE